METAFPMLKIQCPDEAEDMDGDQDEDGCPDGIRDADKDGIPDDQDQCPTEPETFNQVKDEDGCPDKSKGPIQNHPRKNHNAPCLFRERAFTTTQKEQANAWSSRADLSR